MCTPPVVVVVVQLMEGSRVELPGGSRVESLEGSELPVGSRVESLEG